MNRAAYAYARMNLQDVEEGHIVSAPSHLDCFRIIADSMSGGHSTPLYKWLQFHHQFTHCFQFDLYHCFLCR